MHQNYLCGLMLLVLKGIIRFAFTFVSRDEAPISVLDTSLSRGCVKLSLLAVDLNRTRKTPRNVIVILSDASVWAQWKLSARDSDYLSRRVHTDVRGFYILRRS